MESKVRVVRRLCCKDTGGISGMRMEDERPVAMRMGVYQEGRRQTTNEGPVVIRWGMYQESSTFLSFHQETYVRQIVPSQCLAQPMAMSLAVVRSWGEQTVSIMGQTSGCCMVCLMPVTGFLFVGKSPL